MKTTKPITHNCTFGEFQTRKVNGVFVSIFSENVLKYLVRDFLSSYVSNEITMARLYRHVSRQRDFMGWMDKIQFLEEVLPVVEKRVTVTGRKFKQFKSFR